MPADRSRGVLDTDIVVLRARVDPAELPEEVAITAVTLAELSAGPHLTDDALERARRLQLLQRVEAEFDPIPFDVEAARIFGRLSAVVRATGRTPRRRVADLMIAATAAAQGMPLYTTNIDDFRGLDDVVEVIKVARPPDIGR